MGVQVRGDGQEVRHRAEGAGGFPERDQHHLGAGCFDRRAGFVASSCVFQIWAGHMWHAAPAEERSRIGH